MKWALIWYYCGLAAVCLGIGMIIWGVVGGDDLYQGGFPMIIKGISGVFFGLIAMGIWSRQIAKHKSLKKDVGQLLQESQEQFTTFQKENCVGCKFADEAVMRNFTAWNFKKWCLRPELPEISKDDKWCFSRERKQ